MSRYGSSHRALRRQWTPIVAAGRATCTRCGEPILSGEPWDLGHKDGAHRDEHDGPQHARCNRATRTHLAASRTRPTDPHPGLIGD